MTYPSSRYGTGGGRHAEVIVPEEHPRQKTIVPSYKKDVSMSRD